MILIMNPLSAKWPAKNGLIHKVSVFFCIKLLSKNDFVEELVRSINKIGMR